MSISHIDNPKAASSNVLRSAALKVLWWAWVTAEAPEKLCAAVELQDTLVASGERSANRHIRGITAESARAGTKHSGIEMQMEV
jgi:hypothetical protein